MSKIYCLNAGQNPPVLCTNSKEHLWKYPELPHELGTQWHEKVCTECGVKITWDTSD